MAYVNARLGRMRKSQLFSVLPTDDGRVMVQSSRSIGLFDFRTGKGVLNIKGCYFVHLNRALGAESFDFPPDFVRDCLAACPALDSEIELGLGVVMHTTVRGI